MVQVKADGSMSLRDDYDDNEAGLLDIVENPTFQTALVHKGYSMCSIIQALSMSLNSIHHSTG